jgi:hypothetical protein
MHSPPSTPLSRHSPDPGDDWETDMTEILADAVSPAQLAADAAAAEEAKAAEAVAAAAGTTCVPF